MKRVLMVAYHFPPMNVSSGIQRTLRFAQHLPDNDWEPTVLTAHARAYPGMSKASLSDVPADLRVRRAFALDAARHLSLKGRYPRFLALPDRWTSWWLGGVPAGLELIRKFKPDVLWSTYPIATAHLIGYTLHRLTRIPWVADFRDPMAEFDEPAKADQNRALSWIEQRVLRDCRCAVFTTPGARDLYASRYPQLPRSRLAIIENGYDESAFADAEQAPGRLRARGEPLLLLHSGTIYPSARDPRPLFAALSGLRERGQVSASTLRVVLRASGCDFYLQNLIEQHGIGDLVKLESAIPYRAALAEMLSADGLLLLQAANCNYQIPAKLYEYLRARRPVLALTDPVGDTASVLRDAGIDTIAPLDSEEAISRILMQFIHLLRDRRAPIADESKVVAASRRIRTAELARILDAAAA